MAVLYCMTEVRLITFRSLILERFDSNSSWMPSSKKAFSCSSLRFSSGSTAMLFSETLDVPNFPIAKLVPKRTPLLILLQVVGDMFRKEYVSGIAAIHDALRDVNS